jgi:CRP-like cAMP-binding protein
MRVRVRCLTEVRACQYEAGLLRDVIYTRGDLLSHLMADCLANMAAQDEQLLNVGARTSEEALAYFVLKHFRRQIGSEQRDGEVVFPMRLSDIADTIGVTEVHAGRLMRRLEAEGLVERRSSNLLFVNRAGLESFTAA